MNPKIIPLPQPDPLENGLTLLLNQRRSVRRLIGRELTANELATLLWSAQGATENGRRTAPSAGEVYPLQLHVAMASGLFRYDSEKHQLERVADEDLRVKLADVGLGQSALSDAPAVVIFTAHCDNVDGKYGDNGKRFIHMEMGHAAQNLQLAATALGLASVAIGQFFEEGVRDLLSLGKSELLGYLIPVGEPLQAADEQELGRMN